MNINEQKVRNLVRRELLFGMIIESTFDNAKKRSSVYDPLNINSEIPPFFLKACDPEIINSMIYNYEAIKQTAERFLMSSTSDTVEMEDFYGQVLSLEELEKIVNNCERKILQLKAALKK
jgi:hypothetical protein